MAVDGYDLVLLGLFKPTISNECTRAPEKFSMVLSETLISVLVGASEAGIVTDRSSQKNASSAFTGR